MHLIVGVCMCTTSQRKQIIMKTYQNYVDILGGKVTTLQFCCQRHVVSVVFLRSYGSKDIWMVERHSVRDAASGPLDIKGVWRRKRVISSDGQRKDVRKPHFRSKGQHSFLLTGNWFPHGWTEMEQLWSG